MLTDCVPKLTDYAPILIKEMTDSSRLTKLNSCTFSLKELSSTGSITVKVLGNLKIIVC